MRRKRGEGQLAETELWLREIAKRIWLLMSKNSRTRKILSMSTFSEYPQWNSNPSYQASMLRDMRF